MPPSNTGGETEYREPSQGVPHHLSKQTLTSPTFVRARPGSKGSFGRQNQLRARSLPRRISKDEGRADYRYRGNNSVPKISSWRLTSSTGSKPWSPCHTNHSGWTFSTNASISSRTSETFPANANLTRARRSIVTSEAGSITLPVG